MAFGLKLLGPPRLVDAAGNVVAYPAKGLVLAAHLALSKEAYAMSRPEAAALLWEGADAMHAGLNLRQLASRIRTRQDRLGLALLRLDGSTIRLDTSAAAIDVARLQRLVALSDACHLDELCALYGGDLLQGVELDGEDGRNRIETHRTRLRHLFIDEVCTQLDGPAAPNPETARAAAERVLDVDPYNERAMRALLLALGRASRPHLARQAYEAFLARLRSDLGVPPEMETARVAALVCGARARREESRVASDIRVGPDGPAALETPPVRPWPRVMIVALGASGSADSTVLARSLVADVTIALCSVRTLAPIAPHSAAAASRMDGETDIAARFRLDFLVECSVTSLHDGTDLYVQLVHAVSREIVWAERFSLDVSAVERSQRLLAERIARAVATSIERAELARFARAREPGAYAHFLMGQEQLNVVDLPRVRRARKFFAAAAAASPAFAAAEAGLARTWHLEWLLLARREPRLLEQALEHAGRAVALDPGDARGHRERGVAELYLGRFDNSIAALDAAEAAGPSYADVLADYADALVHAGDLAAALKRIERAIELNPLCPDDYWWTAGGAYYLSGDYAQSLACLDRMAERRPACRLMAAGFAMSGDQASARRCARIVLEDHPGFRIDEWLAMVQIRDVTRRAHYEQGLRRAGFA
jgi:DNA-binding SARP family transcriptional activator/tetratricopeptide (TPR) repeat protein